MTPPQSVGEKIADDFRAHFFPAQHDHYVGKLASRIDSALSAAVREERNRIRRAVENAERKLDEEAIAKRDDGIYFKQNFIGRADPRRAPHPA